MVVCPKPGARVCRQATKNRAAALPPGAGCTGVVEPAPYLDARARASWNHPVLASRRATGRRLAPLDAAERRRHKLRNLLQSALLLGGMVGLLALCGWLLFGPDGLLGMGLGAALALTFAPRVSPAMVLALYRARELTPAQLPAVFEVLARLSERAGLAQTPRLYYVPSSTLNAFAVGGRASDQRPGRSFSVNASSARSFSAGSSTRAAVPRTTTER